MISEKINNNTSIFKDFNISQGCLNLLNYSYFGRYKNQKIKYISIIKYYFYKLIWQSEKVINQFFKYKSCLEGENSYIPFNNSLNLRLTYVISFIDKTKGNINELKKSSRFE